MKRTLFCTAAFLFVFLSFGQEKATPIFRDGEAQIVKGFKDQSQWIRHDLWVETEFDTDGDGKLDLYICYSGSVPEAKRQNQLFINGGFAVVLK